MEHKVCSKCLQNKPITEFYRNKDKVRPDCKSCVKDRVANYRNSDEGKSKIKQYNESPKGKERMRRFDKSEKRRILRKNAVKNKFKIAVRNKLQYAVKSGKIIKPERCSICNTKDIIHGHHDDYNKPLDVIWVCKKCHDNIHKGD